MDKARFLLMFMTVIQAALSLLVTRSSCLLNSSMTAFQQRLSTPNKKNLLHSSTVSRKTSSLSLTGIWCLTASGMEERVFSLLSLRHLLRFEKHDIHLFRLNPFYYGALVNFCIRFVWESWSILKITTEVSFLVSSSPRS